MASRSYPNRDELLASLRRLSDDELVARLKSLAARERHATVLLVAHIAELDTRDVHLRLGYSSLFAYCREVLLLSEHEALNRIEVARIARRFPAVLDLLASGEVNLTAVRLLGPHLTAQNHRMALESAGGKRKAEVLEIVAALSPRADAPASIRKLPESGRVTVVSAEEPAVELGPTPAIRVRTAVSGSPEAPVRGSTPDALSALAGPSAPAGPLLVSPVAVAGRASAPTVSPQPGRPAEVKPLSPDRYQYQLTIGGATLEKLRLAKDMLRHVLPSGDDGVVLDRALTALLTELARQKFRADREGTASSDARLRSDRVLDPNSRHIPAAVKRAVWLRDLGRCAFVGSDGHRCAERAFVEFHHVRPWAAGGEATVDNIQLRCRRHNGYEARRFFARDSVAERQAHAAGEDRVRGGVGDDRSAAALDTTAAEPEVVLERVAIAAQCRERATG